MSAAKFDIGLALAYERYLSSRGGRPVADEISVFLLYEGDLAPIEAAGFEIAWRGGQRVLGTLRFADLPAIAALPGVVRLVAGMPSALALESATRELHARASSVASIGTDGLWHVDITSGALTSGLATGRGVIIGIIDTGIDITHPAFASSLLPWATRISHVWDQGLTADAMLEEEGPDPALLLSTRTYGVEYDVQEVVGSSIFPDLPSEFRHRDCDGHGTHVASIAAGGNLVTDGMTVGVAPEAELMVVKHLDTPDVVLDTSRGLVTPDQRLLDAVIYLLRKAKAMVKPIVINASMTNSWQPGDGLGESEWFLDRTFDPTADPAGDPETYPPDNHFPTGAVFVKSAGNDGDTLERLTATATIPASGAITVPMELYDRRAPNARKRINCEPVRHVPPVSVKAWCRQVIPVVDITVAAKAPDETGFSDEVASGALAQEFDDGKRWVLSNEVIPMFRPLTTPPGTFGTTWRRRLAMVVEPKPQPPPAAPIHRLGIYELQFKGPPGTVLYLMGTSGGIGMKIAETYSDLRTLLPADIRVTNESSMIESGGRHAITVAAHHDITGELAPFSSRGPLRDFTDPPLGPLAPKPDVSAPGVDIAAALSVDAGGFLAKLSSRFRDGDRETEMEGTSMSAPMVAGIVALMLQKNPDLTVNDVRAALTASTAGRPGANPAPADPGYAEAFGAGRSAALESHANTPS